MPVSSARVGSEEHAEVAMLHEMIRAATAHYITNHPDPRHAMALLMSALPAYAGSLFATLMFMGEVTQQDTARAAKMASTNFRQGITVGLNRAARLAASDELFGATQ